MSEQETPHCCECQPTTLLGEPAPGLHSVWRDGKRVWSCDDAGIARMLCANHGRGHEALYRQMVHEQNIADQRALRAGIAEAARGLGHIGRALDRVANNIRRR